MKNIKNLVMTIAVTMAVGNFTIIQAFADSTKYYSRYVNDKEVSYSVMNAIQNNDSSVFSEWDGIKSSKLQGVYLATLPSKTLYDTYSNQEILLYIQNSPLTAYGCNSTVSELFSYLIPDRDGKNPKYWYEYDSTDWNYTLDNQDKQRAISFQYFDKNSGKGFIIRFHIYKSTNDIALSEVILERSNEKSLSLSQGQIVKLFKELETMNSNSKKLMTNVVNGGWYQNSRDWYYGENGKNVSGWKLIDGKWYYFYSDGTMAHDIKIDGYYLSTSGELRQ